MMTTKRSILKVSVEDFCWRIEGLSLEGSWHILITPELTQIRELVMLLLNKLQATPNMLVELGVSAGDMVEKVGDVSATLAIIFETENFPNLEIERLDFLRSRLQIGKRLIWVLTRDTVERLMEYAPNIASLLDGSVFQWDPSSHLLTDEELQIRLKALRQWSKLSDKQVLALAGKNQLPSDPEYAEWLTLLGHGDLLVGRK